MIVYPASKSKHASWWRALRAAGVPRLSLPGSIHRSMDPVRRSMSGRINAAAEADICLSVCNEGDRAGGALIEAEAALESGKQPFVVSPYV